MSTTINKSSNRNHAIHYKGAADLERSVVEIGKNAVLRFKRPEQAVVTANLRHVEHKITPETAIPATYFSSANGTLDFEYPKVHYLDQEAQLRLNVTNSTAATEDFDSFPSNLFTRREIYYGSELRETITALDMWMDQILYKTPEEQVKAATSTKVSASTFLAAGQATSGAAFPTIRIPQRSHLSACGIPTALISKDVKVRVYSALDTTVFSGADGLAATGCDMHVKEYRGSDSALSAVAGSNLDWRYLKGSLQEETVTLSSGNEAKVKLSNFSEGDLCSHIWVFVRTADLSTDGRDDMLSCITSAWIEDEGGKIIANGLRPTGDELLRMNYADKFPNLANSVHGTYLVFSPSADPFNDYRNGTMSGAQPLSKNMQLKFIPNVSGSHVISVVAMNHKHVRLQAGDVTMN